MTSISNLVRPIAAAAALAVMLCAAPALAQDFGDPQPPPPPPEPPAAEVVGDTDHDSTVGDWGFQLAAIDGIGIAPAATVPILGARRWMSRDSGIEFGVALFFSKDGNPDPLPEPTVLVVGGTFGYMRAMSIHKHATIFWEPQGTLLIAAPDDDIDGTDDDVSLVLDGRVNIGTEVRLGFFGLPQIGVTAKLSAGFRISSEDSTDFFIGTIGSAGSSVEGLLTSSVGFVFYL